MQVESTTQSTSTQSFGFRTQRSDATAAGSLDRRLNLAASDTQQADRLNARYCTEDSGVLQVFPTEGDALFFWYVLKVNRLTPFSLHMSCTK